MTTQFKDIPIGTVFYLHHKEGLRGIKQSTRTARFVEPNRVFYVRQTERVLVEGLFFSNNTTERERGKNMNTFERNQIMQHVLFRIKVLVEEGDDIKISNEMSKLLKPVKTEDLNEFIIKR